MFKKIILSAVISVFICSTVFYVNAAEHGVRSGIEDLQVDPQSGSASTSFPIAVPQGRGGISPNINLSYNSNNKNGMLGFGWGLELGSIHLSTKNGIPQYGVNEDVVLMQNGSTQELRYDELVGYYRPKIEGGFLKIEKSGDIWTITDKTGIKYTFGKDLASREYNPINNTKVLKWCLNRVEDVYGNYMEIDYVRDGNKLYPLEVRYTGNAAQGLSPYAKVNFQLEARPDIARNYIAGYEGSVAKRISQIDVSVDNQVQHSYQFNYIPSTATGRSLLKTVTQLGADGISTLPDTTFTYQNEDGQNAVSYASSYSENAPVGNNLWEMRAAYADHGNNNVFYVIPGDNAGFYSDGKKIPWTLILTKGDHADPEYRWRIYSGGKLEIRNAQDRAFYAKTYLYVNDQKNVNISMTGDVSDLFLNEAINSPSRVGNFTLRAGQNIIHFTGYNQNQHSYADIYTALSSYAVMNSRPFSNVPQFSGDFNGDGLTDIGRYSPATLDVETAISNGSGFNARGQWIDNFGTATDAHLLGDFNADGRSDTAIFSPSSGNWTVAFSDGSQFNTQGNWITGFGNSKSQPTTGDFNGDGLTDIAYFNRESGNFFINFSLNKGGSFEVLKSVSLTANSDDIGFAADFNGDGLTDVGIFDESAGKWSVYINNGDLTTILDAPIVLTGFGVNQKLAASDYNADGLTDIAYFDGKTSQVTFRPFNGSGFDAAQTLTLPFNAKGPVFRLQSADYNGDGLADYMITNDVGQLETVLSSGVVTDLLASVENGLGGKSSLVYDSSTNYPNTYLPFSVPVVKSTTASTAQGDLYTTQYEYGKGLWDPVTREFRGFGMVKVIDPEGNYVETDFFQDEFKKGNVSEQRQYDSLGSLFSKTQSTYLTTQICTGVYFVSLQRKDNFVYDGDATGRRTAEEFTYGETPQLGNLTKALQLGEVDFVTGDDIASDSRTVETQYVNNVANQILGLPSVVTVKDNAGNPVRQTWFDYDNLANGQTPTLGLLSKKTDWAGAGNTNPVTQYSYNAFGNLKTTTDPRGKVTAINYDASYQLFPLTTVNALGHSVVNEYYGVNGVALSSGGFAGIWGQLKSTTDPNNNKGTRVYDTFGRQTASISPLDSVSFPTSLTQIDFGSTYTKVTSQQRINHGLAPTITAYQFSDGLGRVIQSKTLSAVAGQYVISGQTQYNSRGLPEKQYLPFFSTDTLDTIVPIDPGKPFTSVVYDAMGRVTFTMSPDTTFSSIEYKDWTTVTTDANGHKQESNFDAYGRLIEKREYLGADGRSAYYPAVSYTPYATTLYKYDSEGNLVQTTDAQGNVTTISYDNLGRKVAMNDPDMGIWTYAYDLNGNLIEQTDAKGQSIYFQYDDLNRLVNKTDQIDLNVTYTYDDPLDLNSKGRLTQAQYDTNDQTQFKYDVLGREIQSIKKINNTSFDVQRGYDALNNLINIQYPDTEQIFYKYNPAGQIKSISNDQTLFDQQSSVSDQSSEFSGQVSEFRVQGSVVSSHAGESRHTGARRHAGESRYPERGIDSGSLAGMTSSHTGLDPASGENSHTGLDPASRLRLGIKSFYVNIFEPYVLGVSSAQAADVVVAQVNFQGSSDAVPTGYIKADMSLYSSSLGYGWLTSPDGSRDRNINADQSLDTFIYAVATSGVSFEYDLPNGNYLVSLASGDAGYAQGPFRIDLEGATVFSNIYTNVNEFEIVNDYPVTVNDGQLTLTVVGSGSDGTLINYLIIKQADVVVPQVPSAPILNSANPGDGVVNLSWSAVSGSDGYRVYYRTSSGNYGSAAFDGNATSTVISGLTNATQYYFIVRAYNATGESIDSNELSATPVSNGGGNPGAVVAQVNFQPSYSTVPTGYLNENPDSLYSGSRGYGWLTAADGNRVRNIQADQRYDTFVYATANNTFEWVYDLPNGSYVVSLASGDAGYAQGEQRISIEGSLVVDVASLNINEFVDVVDYPVTVSDGQLNVLVGGSSASTLINYLIIKEADAVVPQVPSAPTLSAANPADGVVNLSWSSVAEADGYRVYYGTSSGNLSVLGYDGTLTNKNITGLANDVPYYFIVRAYNVAGESIDSNELFATPVVGFMNGEFHWLESENFDTQFGAFAVSNDAGASNSELVLMPDGSGDNWSPSTTDMVTYDVNIAEAGDYILFGRVLAVDGNNDSFYVQIDSGVDNLWDVMQGSSWLWDKVSHRGGANPVIFNLSAGIHTIKVKGREDGTKLDKLLLTNDLSYAPSGVGASAENLPGNQPPVAVIGTPQINGLTVNFVGDQSSDADNDPLTYNWDFGDGQSSTLMNPSHTYNTASTYTVSLTVGDGSLSDIVSVSVSVSNGLAVEKHWVETETFNAKFGAFAISSDNNASNTEFVSMPDGFGDNWRSSTTDMVAYDVNIVEAGDYILFGRVLAVDGNNDSFYVQIDSGADNLWDVMQGSSWLWDKVSHRGGANPVIFNLSAGVHTIKIKGREDGTKIDKLLLTNDLSYVPNGMGGSSVPPPAAPTMGSAQSGDTQIQLSWNSLIDATGYRISYGTMAGVYDTVIDVGDVTSFMVTGLANDVPCFLVVQAYNQGGSSSYSNELSSTPTAFTPLNPTLFVKNVEYNASGQVLSIEYGNGDIKTYTYNALTLRVERIYTVNSSGVDLQDLSYTYDSVGNILSIIDNVNTASQTFQYDELNRLVDANGAQYGQKNYVYDEVGNIVEKDSKIYSYAEGGAGVHAVTSLSDGTTFTYDANGNMFTKQESDGTLTQFTYDPENRLTKVVKAGATIAEYIYDGDGGRTSKKVNGITTTFVGSLYEETLAKGTKSIFLGSTRIASVVNGKVFYYHGDHLGGTNVVTDDVGDVNEIIEYMPFGKESRRDKFYADPVEQARYTFSNHYKDEETGLIFMQARYYDPSLGRFITADTIVQDPTNPQTLNRYTYANNNPVNNIDPSGHGWFKKLWNFFKKNTIVGGFIEAVQTGDWGQFGRQVAVLVISSAANILVPGIGATFSSNLFINTGLQILRGAAVGAVVGGASSVVMGGSFAQGAVVGAIAGGITGAVQGVRTSEQYQNFKAGNGFRSNKMVQAVKSGKINTVDVLNSANATNDPEQFSADVGAYVKLNGSEVDSIIENGLFKFNVGGDGGFVTANFNTIIKGVARVGAGLFELTVSGISIASSGGVAAPVSGIVFLDGLRNVGIGTGDIVQGIYGKNTIYSNFSDQDKAVLGVLTIKSLKF